MEDIIILNMKEENVIFDPEKNHMIIKTDDITIRLDISKIPNHIIDVAAEVIYSKRRTVSISN